MGRRAYCDEEARGEERNEMTYFDRGKEDAEKFRKRISKLTDTEAGPKPCVLCGTQPQAIGLHCNNCWNDLADQDPLMWLPE